MFPASATVGSVLLGDFDDGKRLGQGMSVKPPSITIVRSMPTNAPHFMGSIEKADGRTQECARKSERWHNEGLAPPKALDVGEELLRYGDWEEGRGGDDPVKGLCWGALTPCLPIRAPEEDALTDVEISLDAPLQVPEAHATQRVD